MGKVIQIIEEIPSRSIRGTLDEVPRFLEMACGPAGSNPFPLGTLMYAFKVWDLLTSWGKVITGDQDDGQSKITERDFKKALKLFCKRKEIPYKFIMDYREECIVGVCLNEFDLFRLHTENTWPLKYLNAAIAELKNFKKKAICYSRRADDVYGEWRAYRVPAEMAELKAYWEKMLAQRSNNKNTVEIQENN